MARGVRAVVMASDQILCKAGAAAEAPGGTLAAVARAEQLASPGAVVLAGAEGVGEEPSPLAARGRAAE